jgi:c-di-GMP-binding flagellar brake protein YcgR
MSSPFPDNFRPADTAYRAPRYAVHWKIAIMYEKNGKKELFKGRTFEVSASGTSFLSQHNIFVEGEVTVLLALAWYRDNLSEKVVEIRARMIHTILSSESQMFRTGLQFISFKEGTSHFLEIALRDQQKIKSF